MKLPYMIFDKIKILSVELFRKQKRAVSKKVA